MLIATGHIVGALLLTIFIWVVSVEFEKWLVARMGSISPAQVAAELRVSVEDLESPDQIEILLRPYRNDLFVNRLSDFAFVLKEVWFWFGAVVTFWVVIFVLWNTAFGDRSSAVLAWAAPALTLFFLISLLIGDFVCRLLTGRNPGEAKQKRRVAAEYFKRQGERRPHV